MKIGILGSGNVGSTLGAAFMKAGHEVAFGRRGTLGEVAANAEVLVLATPFEAMEEVVNATGPMEGKIVIDASNPLGPGLSLVVGHTDSGAEVLQRRLPGARVVKCFNSVGIEVMANPLVGGRAANMFLCGNDGQARATVRTLATELGFDALEVGPSRTHAGSSRWPSCGSTSRWWSAWAAASASSSRAKARAPPS